MWATLPPSIDPHALASLARAQGVEYLPGEWCFAQPPVVPIIASISRELFLGVPHELEEGALALGTTRWEMVRGVILPATRSGIAAAVILGLGRAIGEAIAVTQVIGGGTRIGWSLFPPADTLASKLASSYQGANPGLEISSLLYLASILLVIGLLANLAAQLIVRRFDPLRA